MEAVGCRFLDRGLKSGLSLKNSPVDSTPLEVTLAPMCITVDVKQSVTSDVQSQIVGRHGILPKVFYSGILHACFKVAFIMNIYFIVLKTISLLLKLVVSLQQKYMLKMCVLGVNNFAKQSNHHSFNASIFNYWIFISLWLKIISSYNMRFFMGLYTYTHT